MQGFYRLKRDYILRSAGRPTHDADSPGPGLDPVLVRSRLWFGLFCTAALPSIFTLSHAEHTVEHTNKRGELSRMFAGRGRYSPLPLRCVMRLSCPPFHFAALTLCRSSTHLMSFPAPPLILNQSLFFPSPDHLLVLSRRSPPCLSPRSFKVKPCPYTVPQPPPQFALSSSLHLNPPVPLRCSPFPSGSPRPRLLTVPC